MPTTMAIAKAIQSLGLASRSTVPSGRVGFSLVSRHFVPGYFRLVPPGQDILFHCRIFLKLALMVSPPPALTL
jgi:hypothetical protein